MKFERALTPALALLALVSSIARADDSASGASPTARDAAKARIQNGQDEAFRALDAEEDRSERREATDAPRSASSRAEGAVLGAASSTSAASAIESKPPEKTSASHVVEIQGGAPAGLSTAARARSSWNTWWDRPRGISEGDLIPMYTVGVWGRGLYQGLGLEMLATDEIGIDVSVQLGGYAAFDRYGGRNVWRNNSDWDFFIGGKTAGPVVDNRDVDFAILHLENLSAKLHLGGGSGFDVAPSLGFSHFGYHLDLGSQTVSGGSGFVRAGIAAQWIHKRFMAGVDAGWHPIQLLSYGVVGRSYSAPNVETREVAQVFDPLRFTASVFLGLSL